MVTKQEKLKSTFTFLLDNFLYKIFENKKLNQHLLFLLDPFLYKILKNKVVK